MRRLFARLAITRRRRYGVVGLTIVSDSANRANSAVAIGTADTGQVWTAHTGTWGINGNAIYLVTPAGGARNLASIPSGVSDCTVYHTVTNHPSGSSHGAVIRLADASNYILILISGNTNIYVYKCVAGSLTLIGSSAALTNATGDVIKIVASGPNIEVFKNDVSVVSGVSETAGQSNTRHGLSVEDATDPAIRQDDFKVTVP